MGELLEQIAAGGPAVMPLEQLDDSCRAVVTCLHEDPGGWAFDLRRDEMLKPLRQCILAAAAARTEPDWPSDGILYSSYDDLMQYTARARYCEDWARTLIAWCRPDLPAMIPGPRGWGATFRAAILKMAARNARHESEQRECLCADAQPWERRCIQVLAACIRSAPTR